MTENDSFMTKKYLNKYHLQTYNKLAKYLNHKEKKWLLNLI